MHSTRQCTRVDDAERDDSALTVEREAMDVVAAAEDGDLKALVVLQVRELIKDIAETFELEAVEVAQVFTQAALHVALETSDVDDRDQVASTIIEALRLKWASDVSGAVA